MRADNQPAETKHLSRAETSARCRTTALRKSMAHRPANKDLPSHRPSRQSLDTKEFRPEDAKAQANYPQFLFRLERTPIACFQQLTRVLNEPMFRLERIARRIKIERSGLNRGERLQNSLMAISRGCAPTGISVISPPVAVRTTARSFDCVSATSSMSPPGVNASGPGCCPTVIGRATVR